MRVYKVVDGALKSIFADMCYIVEYDDTGIIHAHPDTLGIFCFLTLDLARMFSPNHERIPILEVEGIGMPRIPFRIAFAAARNHYGIALDRYLSDCTCPCDGLHPAVPGTVCFDAVRVIREV